MGHGLLCGKTRQSIGAKSHIVKKGNFFIFWVKPSKWIRDHEDGQVKVA